MFLLVDTHALIWLLERSPKIDQRHIDLVMDPDNAVDISAVSILEITTKCRIGKLDIPQPYIGDILLLFDHFNYVRLPFTPAHAAVAGMLAGIHKDPFDCQLAAQSIVEHMHIMTIDPAIRGLGAEVVG